MQGVDAFSSCKILSRRVNDFEDAFDIPGLVHLFKHDADGELVWRVSTGVFKTVGPRESASVGPNDEIYAVGTGSQCPPINGNDNSATQLRRFDPETGNVIWESNLNTDAFGLGEFGERVIAGPLSGHAYVQSLQGRIFKVDKDTGDVLAHLPGNLYKLCDVDIDENIYLTRTQIGGFNQITKLDSDFNIIFSASPTVRGIDRLKVFSSGGDIWGRVNVAAGALQTAFAQLSNDASLTLNNYIVVEDIIFDYIIDGTDAYFGTWGGTVPISVRNSLYKYTGFPASPVQAWTSDVHVMSSSIYLGSGGVLYHGGIRAVADGETTTHGAVDDSTGNSLWDGDVPFPVDLATQFGRNVHVAGEDSEGSTYFHASFSTSVCSEGEDEDPLIFRACPNLPTGTFVPGVLRPLNPGFALSEGRAHNGPPSFATIVFSPLGYDNYNFSYFITANFIQPCGVFASSGVITNPDGVIVSGPGGDTAASTTLAVRGQWTWDAGTSTLTLRINDWGGPGVNYEATGLNPAELDIGEPFDVTRISNGIWDDTDRLYPQPYDDSALTLPDTITLIPSPAAF